MCNQRITPPRQYSFHQFHHWKSSFIKYVDYILPVVYGGKRGHYHSFGLADIDTKDYNLIELGIPSKKTKYNLQFFGNQWVQIFLFINQTVNTLEPSQCTIKPLLLNKGTSTATPSCILLLEGGASWGDELLGESLQLVTWDPRNKGAHWCFGLEEYEVEEIQGKRCFWGMEIGSWENYCPKVIVK